MKKPSPSPLYWHRDVDAYECLGCGELLEVPQFAVMKGGHAREQVKHHPENRMLWIELQTLDHALCHQFKDQQMAENARRFRRKIIRLCATGAGQRNFPSGAASG